jgi:phospholipid/cholesterol/gamma-HCH transport system substrate-binding protein
LKKDISHNIRLGIFITLGIVLFFAGIYFIGMRQQLFTGTFSVSGVFKDVSGLHVGNNVIFAGVNVGTIADITIVSDSSVRVDMRIDEDARRFIRKDARACIGSEGLMGNKILVITPGAGGAGEIENNDQLATTESVKVDDILKQVKTTSDNVALLTGDLTRIVDAISSGKGTVGKLLMDSTYLKIPLENAAQISADLAVIVGRLRTGRGVLGKLMMDSTYLKIPIENASHIAKDLSEIVGALRSGKGVAGRLIMDSTYLKIPIENVAQITADLTEIAGGIRAGKGTLGKFARDDEFYNHLERTITSLDSLLKDVQANPGRYVKISVF